MEPGEGRLTSRKGARESIDQDVKGRLAQLPTRLAVSVHRGEFHKRIIFKGLQICQFSRQKLKI
jgi:hypothetical protein